MVEEGVEAVELTREMVVGLLRPYSEAREQERSYGKQRERLGQLIRHFIETHDGEVIRDGEYGIEARLQERALPGREYDLVTLWEKDRLLFERLVLHGCLRADDAAVKMAGQQVGGAEAYAFPKKTTTALAVEERKRVT